MVTHAAKLAPNTSKDPRKYQLICVRAMIEPRRQLLGVTREGGNSASSNQLRRVSYTVATSCCWRVEVTTSKV